jgi:hypothetical protein
MEAEHCKKEEIRDYGIRAVITRMEPEPILCACCCFRPVNQNDPLFFAGELGCEKCVRDYYNRQYRGLTTNRNFNESFESFFQTELKFRRHHGERVLKQIRQRCRR